METSWGRRLKCQTNIGDILMVGEQLRVRMHTDNPHLIKDRRHHFRMYTSCFVGKEAVDWLVESGQATDRDTAIFAMNVLLSKDVIRHVSDEHSFKDENYLYRFRKDDGTFPWYEAVTLFLKGQRLFNRLVADRKSVMRNQEEGGVVYYNCFQGSQLIDWLIGNGDFSTRQEAIAECRRMLENEVLRHVSDAHHFKDEALLYQFKTDYSRKPKLVDLVVHEPQPSDCSPSASPQRDRMGKSPACGWTGRSPQSPGSTTQSTQNALDIPRERRPQRTESGYHSYPEDEVGNSPHNGSPTLQVFNGHSQSPASATGFLFRKATAEDLEDPNSPFIKKHIRIASDPVGFGFVVRGEGPSYVKTVDPTGPAAQAGLKVGHYLLKVNDQRVINMNHRDLAHVILSHMGYLRLVIMEHVRDKST